MGDVIDYLWEREHARGRQKYIICNRFYISVALFPKIDQSMIAISRVGAFDDLIEKSLVNSLGGCYFNDK